MAAGEEGTGLRPGRERDQRCPPGSPTQAVIRPLHVSMSLGASGVSVSGARLLGALAVGSLGLVYISFM